MADNIFTYENVKNNKEIGDQWRNYVLQKFKDRPSWLLLTQSLGDNNTLQIDKLTPEFFNAINKIYGAPIRAPLMQKSAQQTPDNQKDFVPAVEPATQNDKTDKPVVVTGGQPSNGNPSKKPRMSDDEIDAFLKEELGGNTTDGTYASPGVPKGGTKTIGYDPNPGAALIDEWNREHGISYVTGEDGLIYRIDPQHPNGYVDPFKNDLSKTGSTGYATGKGMLTSGSDGTYATGEGIKDANGNVLTNPGEIGNIN